MYSLWRHNTRLGTLVRVESINQKKDGPTGIQGILIPDDPALTFRSMSQNRMILLRHGPVLQNYHDDLKKKPGAYEALHGPVRGMPLEKLPNDEPGVPVEDILEVRINETDVVASNQLWMRCDDIEISDETAGIIADLGMPDNLRQWIHVMVTHAESWPPREFMEMVRREWENEENSQQR